jgi:subtilisin family serine protease
MMRLKASFLLIFILSAITLIGCSSTKTNHEEMDHSQMDHSEMDHSEMGHTNMDHSMEPKPVPSTKDQKEVHQQEVSQVISKWHERGIKGSAVKIAVLDTGIDMESEDLTFSKGMNFVGSNQEDFQDDNGHGTKIAGIIGARENNKLLLGVAPESELFIGKVADQNGNVDFKDLEEGIHWAIEQDVDIINISLEFPSATEQMESAIKEAHKSGIIVVSSSGNIKYPGDVDVAYPGNFPEVIGVGMLNTEGKIYSDEFKKKNVDVFAPGEDIFSMYFDNKMTLDTGVSFATAYTSGYAALLIQHFKDDSMKYDLKILKKALKQNLESNM